MNRVSSSGEISARSEGQMVSDRSIRDEIFIEMADGIELASIVYRPIHDSPVPTILMRSPYDIDDPMTFADSIGQALVRNGYAYVAQNVRGRFRSGGDYSPLGTAVGDGVRTIDWIVQQDWSDEQVGLTGASANGRELWLLACQGHPAVKALAPVITGAPFDGMGYYGPGVAQVDTLLLWSISAMLKETLRRSGQTIEDADLNLLMEQASLEVLKAVVTMPPDRAHEVPGLMEEHARLAAAETSAALRVLARPLQQTLDTLGAHQPWIRDWMNSPRPTDSLWQADYSGLMDQVKVPVLHFGGWNDTFVRGTIRDFTSLSGPGGPPQCLVMSPFGHTMVPAPVGEWMPSLESVPDALSQLMGRSFAPSAETTTRWFDRYLKGELGGDADEPVNLYVQKADRWRSGGSWPLEETKWMSLYLHSEGRASTLSDGSLSLIAPEAEQPDQFEFDPRNPVPSAGGTFLGGLQPYGFFDQGAIEERDDVLVYTTQVFLDGIEVSGPVFVELYVSTSAVDTDFVATLADVDTDGRSTNVSNGVARLACRREMPALVEPGSTQKVTIELSPTSYWFAAGHSIRLQVSSSSYPLMLPNPNTGSCDLGDPSPVVAFQTVYHERARASALILPTIPSGA